MSKKLTPEELQELARELAAIKSRARAEIQDGTQYMETQLTQAPTEQHGWSDSAEIGQRKEIRAAEIGIDQATLAAVALAEKRMADGYYGICLDCEKPIPLARLKAQPTAIRCAACQSAFERSSHS